MKPSHLLVGLAALLGIRRAFTSGGGRGRTGELRYRVPAGQDAAAALAAVRQHELSATIAIKGGYEDVVIVCDPDRDRERVRRVLREAPVDMAGKVIEGKPIVFADEEPGS